MALFMVDWRPLVVGALLWLVLGVTAAAVSAHPRQRQRVEVDPAALKAMND